MSRIALIADENLHGVIVNALRRRIPGVDLVRVQDLDLLGADDSTLLAAAASVRRILVTHDRNTIPRFAYERVVAGLPMPGGIRG